jgi:hypothetical protein
MKNLNKNLFVLEHFYLKKKSFPENDWLSCLLIFLANCSLCTSIRSLDKVCIANDKILIFQTDPVS